MSPFRSRAAEDQDGFGQSLLDDVRFFFRFRRCRTRETVWRKPSDEERHCYEDHPIFGRFGDLLAIADHGDGVWLLRERMWYGYPDPPRFAFFALKGEAIEVATDFNAWPRCWTPDPDALLPGTAPTDRPI